MSFSVVQSVIKVLWDTFHSCFVHILGLFGSSFIGDSSNINVFTKNLILNKLQVTVA